MTLIRSDCVGAYEAGFKEGIEAAAKECEAMHRENEALSANNYGPMHMHFVHRAVAARDLVTRIRSLHPTADSKEE